MSMGLGQSQTDYGTLPYSQFSTALVANSPSAVSAGIVGGASTEPVTGAALINVKSTHLRALGLASASTQTLCNVTGLLAGCVQVNLALMDVAGGGSGANKLATVLYHEINEVLGFGSALPIQMGDNGFIFPEDLFRWASPGVRSCAVIPDTNDPCQTTPRAYFSASSTGAFGTNLSDFNNCANGGDYGDWATVAPPVDLVQNAFGSVGSSAVMTTTNPESTMLALFGYTVAAPTPAPTSATTTTTTTTTHPTTAPPSTSSSSSSSATSSTTTTAATTTAHPTTATSTGTTTSAPPTTHAPTKAPTHAPTFAPVNHVTETDYTPMFIVFGVLGGLVVIGTIVGVVYYMSGVPSNSITYAPVGRGIQQQRRRRVIYV
jgi:hypothetical protein